MAQGLAECQATELGISNINTELDTVDECEAENEFGFERERQRLMVLGMRCAEAPLRWVILPHNPVHTAVTVRQKRPVYFGGFGRRATTF